ncbi:DUF1223 domain-containing protein [Kordiimonas sp. SCSIO 12603]|uniref:DUF1223 domain-containing protein n=1 Tax=Kordiimonas sp. SCSIO 12603 TaxID=2829596 RepID=UPI0021073E7E|nr:DUF1223 domain-containing protein [Kordiimonas sp. SCSIO 12603]UTW59192.1 DUF1223 domain-containing protein [Kordiimonas sp. SCSIO 12603]
MKKLLLPLLFVLFAFSPAKADAPRLTVLELFTSQGCSSCPPADAILKTMRDRPGILTLSWPVDYWDRLGWEDTFAAPYNTMRQTAYNKRFGRGGVFTPQLILDGSVQCIGSKMEKVRKNVAKARARTRIDITPEMSISGNQLTVTLPESTDAKMIAVRVVWYLSDAEVAIGEGENEGRTLHYTNVVRATDLLDEWKGQQRTYTIDLGTGIDAGADNVAILLQEEYGHGAIIGANHMPIS